MTGRIGAIVLAGGRSSRFGRDKLAEPIDGRPLLHHAIAAVRSLSEEVVVVVAPGQDPPLPAGVRLVHDPAAFEGPLAGLAAGLGAIDPAIDRVVVVAGDMPSLQPAVLSRLVDSLGRSVDIALLEVGGEPVPLPMAVLRAPALASARALLAGGERRLRALPGALHATVLAETTWRLDDPQGATLRDIDRPSDLAARTEERS
jgi:molybdopterin-guanine dinucleotide biosynthesis protein A